MTREHRLRRLGWGLLAVTVLFGVVAMHVLAGGQHTAHAVTEASVAPAPQVHDDAGHAAATPDPTRTSGTDHAAGCTAGDCGVIGNGGAVCLALLVSLLLAAVARRIRSWAAPAWRHPRGRLRDLITHRPVLGPPAPLDLGICRT